MRIIAGQHKGRSILSPKGTATRPMTGRVKTALFNILGDLVLDAVVADLFCGTGNLGLEALSRGAGFCYFADRDGLAIARLKRNIQSMDLVRRSHVWRGDVVALLAGWLEDVPQPIDLAFVDPPYALPAKWQWPHAVEKLFDPLADRLARVGTVVLRCHRNIALPAALGRLRVRDQRTYGKMSLVFLSLSDA